MTRAVISAAGKARLTAWNVSTFASTAQLLVQAMLFFQMPMLAFLQL